MQFKQFYLGCLSHASYYIGSDGDAAIIDPQRDVQQYLDEAAAHGQRIKYIIETHSHADFVSGHVELAAKTGGEIIYGQRANTKFPTHKVNDGDELTVGKIKLTFLETPGHTPEGITIIAKDTADDAAPLKMFTGDTLFIGDVGRPDLIGSVGFSAAEMGGMLYDSLHNSILAYPDDTEVYPAHGAGSLCGKSLSKETWSTLGEQRRFNYALQPMSKEDFVKIVATDQPEVPAYFPKSAAKNLEGSAPLTEIVRPHELSTDEILKFDGVVIDVRKNFEYGGGHIPNSINIGLGGQFASWAGTLIPIGTQIAIVAQTQEQIDEAVMRLARVGHETVSGAILIDNYAGEKKMIEQVSVEAVAGLTQTEKYLQFVDVRRPGEYDAGHATRTWNAPLDKLANLVDKLDPATPVYVICQGGYRSSIGTSIFENAGFRTVFNVTGGTAAWFDAGLETVAAATACASSK
ncbi:MAG: MBL fold metallo-hydrolase [Chloracidobacterium sp.]|nr:MBL fold metallo-hydrolase [Chloracidobacterium sp.]